MAIPIPVSRTKIATASWGIPITNEVNRLTPIADTNATDITALKAATAVTAWANLTLQNGWTNYAGYGTARYRKVGDIVYLMGGAQSGAVGSVVCTIPVGFRSPQTFQIPQATWAGVGVITVGNDGTIGMTSGDNRFIGLIASWAII